MRKRLMSGLLAGLMCVGMLAGCGSNAGNETAGNGVEGNAAVSDSTEVGENAAAEVSANENEATAAGEEATRTIVDHLGHEVTIPAEIERIAITSITPLPSVYCMFEGSADRLIGISPSSMAAAENSLLAEIVPGIVDVPTDFMAGGEVNIEELVAMDPDVVFYNASQEEEYEKLTAAGLNAVAFSTTQWGSDSVETFEAWVTLLGEVLNEEDKAAGITEYGREVYDMIQERVASVDESEKPRVLFLYMYKDGVIQTSGSNHFGQYWADATGAINVAEDSDARGFEINMEQVYEWDPDMIYITNFVPYLSEDLYNNAIEGHDWSVVRAVQEENVYKCPLGVYRWYPPSSDTPLMLLWMAKTNYPELFEDIDLEAEMKEYYQKFYGVELTDENIEMIFNPSREAAGA